MNRLKSAYLIFTAFCLSFTAFAQTPAPAPAKQQPAQGYQYRADGLRKGSLASQFDHLNYISKNNYDFKMVRKTNLELIKRNVIDTVSKLQKEINALQSSSENYSANTRELQDSIRLLSDQLSQEKQKTNSLSFLGTNISKTSYNTFVWTIIAVLAIAMFIFLYSYRKAKVDTVEFQKTAAQAQDELSQFRKKAMEKEQLLKRQLQDELNKRL